MPQGSLCWGTCGHKWGLWPSLHIAELRAGLHSAQGTAASRFPQSTCTRCSSSRHAKHILEMG